MFAVAARVVRLYAADPHDFPLFEKPAFLGSYKTVDPSAPVVQRFIRIGHAMKGIDV